MMKILLLIFLCAVSYGSFETGQADTILRVPSAGGRPKFGSNIYVKGLRKSITTISTNYSPLLTEDVFDVSASGGTVTISLTASSSTVTGKIYTIRKSDATLNEVIIDPNGSELIAGLTTYAIQNQNDVVTIINNGSEWLIL